MRLHPLFFILCLSAGSLWSGITTAGATDPLSFDDTILDEALEHPDWFGTSFGDLREDLKKAVEKGKKGIVVYYGQQRCAYCEQFFKQDLAQPDIARYMQENYDVIPVDIWGIEELIDTDGKSYSERELSIKYKANFTPSLVFYDSEGTPVFRVRGFYPPYKFRAALAYVTETFYKKETFRDYLARAEPGMFFMQGGLNERDFFIEPPYDFKTLLKDGKPLAVFFEQGNCHSCDLLHSGPLNKEDTLKELSRMNAAQLDMWSDTPVVTPDGSRTTAKQWANRLGLFHSPSILFFDEDGKEIIRIDSVVQYYRLWGVLDYVNRRGYLKSPDYQAWRLQQRKTR